MGMKLSEVQARVATTTVTWGEDTVDVGYRPAAMTPALIEKVQEAAKSENLDVIGTMLAPLLAWWDVLDDEGQRLPTDAATIKTMPLSFLTTTMSTVQEAMRPPEGKG